MRDTHSDPASVRQVARKLVGTTDTALCALTCRATQVTFTPEFPMQAPEFVFLRPAPRHPHIYSNGVSAKSVPPTVAVSERLDAGHICLDILYDHGAWSPALTIASVARSLLSMLAANTDKSAPAGDDDYCRRVGDSSSRRTRWTFHDDQV